MSKFYKADLATFLNAQPIDFYDQIWFDTTIFNTSLLNAADLAALNAWAANDSPEFILDSTFLFRSRSNNTLEASAESFTINQALALQSAGGGIFIGTDHNTFANTANQILNNFGFDSQFTGVFNLTSNGSFVGDLFLQPETVVESDFFTNNLQGLSTSNVPVGTHVLNENGGNRTIEIFENLFSFSPGRVSHIGASFEGENSTVPEPPVSIAIVLIGALMWFCRKK